MHSIIGCIHSFIASFICAPEVYTQQCVTARQPLCVVVGGFLPNPRRNVLITKFVRQILNTEYSKLSHFHHKQRTKS